MDPDMIMLECDEHMQKSINYLKNELRGVRTGRASTGLVEFVKVDAYGSTTDLKNLASISTPDPGQILVKPFDPSTIGDIIKAIERADLGMNPQSDGKVLRIPIPSLSGERRQQLAGQVKTMGENAKIAIRNARREANKHLEQAGKDKTLHISEDVVKDLKNDVQEATKKFEKEVDSLVESKTKEIVKV